jgi:hypothetical protein
MILSYDAIIRRLLRGLITSSPWRHHRKALVSITARRIFMKFGMDVMPLDSTGLGQGPVTSCCECGDGSSGSLPEELVT